MIESTRRFAEGNIDFSMIYRQSVHSCQEERAMSEQIGVLIIGVKGAVATTLISAGVATRLGMMGRFDLPSEQDPNFRDVALPPLSSMHFGGWDVTSASLSASTRHHHVIPGDIIEKVACELDKVWISAGVTLTPAPIHDELDRSIVRAEESREPAAAQQARRRQGWSKGRQVREGRAPKYGNHPSTVPIPYLATALIWQALEGRARMDQRRPRRNAEGGGGAEGVCEAA